MSHCFPALQACKSDQLEQVVYQMRSDLQQATQLLEHTGGTVHEQAAINQQLQEQMQQVGRAGHRKHTTCACQGNFCRLTRLRAERMLGAAGCR